MQGEHLRHEIALRQVVHAVRNRHRRKFRFHRSVFRESRARPGERRLLLGTGSLQLAGIRPGRVGFFHPGTDSHPHVRMAMMDDSSLRVGNFWNTTKVTKNTKAEMERFLRELRVLRGEIVLYLPPCGLFIAADSSRRARCFWNIARLASRSAARPTMNAGRDRRSCQKVS